MELFNNFKKNDIPKEKKPIQNFYFIQAEYGGFTLYDCVKFEAALESLFYFHATR